MSGRLFDSRHAVDADAQITVILDDLAERFGEGFAAVGTQPTFDSTERGERVVSFELAPNYDPSKVFSATLTTEADTGKVLGEATCDWPQYLFRDRFLAPFAESLAGAEGLAGWALTMTHSRYDARAWREGDYEAYMGARTLSDPYARVFLVLPESYESENWQEVVRAAIVPLCGLGESFELFAAPRGANPLRSWLYANDTDQIPLATRKDMPPTTEQIRKRQHLRRPTSSDEVWDGTSTGGDPGLESYLPQVTWNPGFEPGA